MQPRRTIIALAIAASLLAGGCCCPMLSGRYSEVGCCPPHLQRCCPGACAPGACPSAACPPAGCLPADSFCPPADAACPPADAVYYDAPQECLPASDAGECGRSPLARLHCSCLSRWLTLGFGQGNVPSQQHPAYYSPPAKFHPIPTRPAFEPLPSYPPLMPADSGMNNPLRASVSPPTAPLSR